jgi:hypothetical protein
LDDLLAGHPNYRKTHKNATTDRSSRYQSTMAMPMQQAPIVTVIGIAIVD